MCDGQPAVNCDFMKLAVFQTTFNDRLTTLHDQFSTMNDILKIKKEAFIQMYRKDPRLSHDDAVLWLQRTIEVLDPFHPKKDQNAIQEQLEKLKQQLAQQQGIAAEAEELRRRLSKTQRERNNLEYSLAGAKRQNEELQSVLENEAREKSNLTNQLEDMKQGKSNLEIANEKLTNGLKAVNTSRSEADGKIKRLEGLLQQTQSELRDAELFKAEQTKRIKKMEEDLKNARSKRKGLGLIKAFTQRKGQPKLCGSEEAVETVETVSLTESKQTIVCDRFSDDNVNVTVSSCKRSVKGNSAWWSYCFLSHPKIENNKIFKWSFRVPKNDGGIGIVIDNNLLFLNV